jgi:hypothetical protein
MEFHPPTAPANGTPNGLHQDDEAFKIPINNVIPHEHPYKNGIKRTRTPKWLSSEQIESFDKHGILIIPAAEMWKPDEQTLLVEAVNVMNDWPDAPGKWMKYYEKKKNPEDPKLLCRVENFTQYNPGLNYLLNGEKLLGMLTDLFDEPATLYKKKINYKLPGGDGFAPHQDVAAGWWMYGQTLHISTLVCIDEANASNGCLELVWDEHKNGMACEPWKEITQETCDKMDWKMAPTKPGDVVFFDSYVPHRSGPNTSQKPRRVLYATYAKASEGNLRNRYYVDKRASFPPDCEREAGKVYEYKI